MVWLKGLSEDQNVVMNLANLEHDDCEVVRQNAGYLIVTGNFEMKVIILAGGWNACLNIQKQFPSHGSNRGKANTTTHEQICLF